MDFEQARRFALALPEAMQAPHFQSVSFRIRGKIFATVPPHGEFLHVFVGEEDRETALAIAPRCIEKLFWGKRVAGLRIKLAAAKPEHVKNLLRKAWTDKAPKKLVEASTAAIDS